MRIKQFHLSQCECHFYSTQFIITIFQYLVRVHLLFCSDFERFNIIQRTNNWY